MATSAAAAMVAKARNDIISHFMRHRAVSPETAVPYEPGRRIRRRLFDRLQRLGVIVPAKGGHYLDVARYDSYARTRRRRAVGAAVGAVAVIAALVAAFA